MANKILSSENMEKILQKITTLFQTKSDIGHNHSYDSLVNLPTIPDKTSQLTNDSGFLTSGDLQEVDLAPYVSEVELEERLTDDVDALDIWNVVPSEDTGTGGGGGTGGTSNYNSLYNLPKINGTTLTGNMVSSDISVADAVHTHIISEIDGLQAILQNKASANHTHAYSSLTGKPTGLSYFENDAGFVTNGTLATLLDDKADVSYVDVELAKKANATDTHTHANKTLLDGITTAKVTEWNNKSNFSGNYTDLTNKPTIPTKVSELTNDSNYQTKTQMDEAIANAVSGGSIDLNGYVTDSELTNALATKADSAHTHNEYISDIRLDERINALNISSLATKVELATKADSEHLHEEYVTNTELDERIGNIDLSALATKEELATKADAIHTHAISDVADLQTTLDAKALKTELHSHSNKTVLDGITSSKVTVWDNKSDFSGNYNDLTNKPSIPTNVSELNNDKAYQTKSDVDTAIANAVTGGTIDLSGYTTDDELSEGLATKADATHAHAISDVTNLQTILDAKALKTEIHSHSNKDVLDGITSIKVTEWNNKSTFSGNYADLTNKPTIPAKTSQLTNDSDFATNATVTSGLAGKANTSHTHDIGDVTNLQTRLDAKSDTGHTHDEYLTEHQDISGLATKEELTTKMELADKQNMFLYSSGATGVPTLATSFVYYRGYVYVNSGYTTTNEVTNEEEKVLRIRSQSSARTGAYFQPMEFSYTDFVHGIPYTLSFEYRVPSTSTFDVNTFKLLWEDCMYDCTDDCVQTIFNVVDLEVINEENGWKRVTCTHTFSEAHPSGGFWFEMDVDGNSSTCDIYLRNFKLEKGTEATPYAISADEQLLNMIEDVDDKTIYASEVSGIEDLINYYAKEDILPETFKSMFVGGNNLIDDPENRIMDIDGAYTVTANQTVDEWGTGNAFHVTGTTPSNILTIGYIHTKADESDYQKVGTLYASSMYIKNNGTTTLSIHFNGGELEGFPREAQVNAGECKRIWVAGVGSSGSKLCFVIDNKSTSSAVDFYYWRPIIQEGSIPSPWELANLALTTTADIDVIWNES